MIDNKQKPPPSLVTYVTLELKAAAEEAAWRQRLSLSEWLRMLIERELGRETIAQNAHD